MRICLKSHGSRDRTTEQPALWILLNLASKIHENIYLRSLNMYLNTIIFTRESVQYLYGYNPMYSRMHLLSHTAHPFIAIKIWNKFTHTAIIQANKNEKRLTEFGVVMMSLEVKNLGTEPELPFLDLYCFSKDYKNDSHEYKFISTTICEKHRSDKMP